MNADANVSHLSPGMLQNQGDNDFCQNKEIPNAHAEGKEKPQDSFLNSPQPNSPNGSAAASVSGTKRSARERHIRLVSISSPQASGSNAIPQQRNVNDRRRKLEEIHVISLNAAKRYIHQFKANAQAHLPWLAAESPQSKATTLHQQAIERLYWEHEPTESLKENVSTINSIFWERGRLLRVLMPGAEDSALNVMQCLSQTSKTLLKYMDAGDAELDVLYLDMIQAGCDFCHCLGDAEAEARLKAKPLFLSEMGQKQWAWCKER